jgi:hypothetical protein
MSHTPGEWEYHEYTVTCGERFICEMNEIWGDNNEWDPRQTEANARLIAAAPDLLKACQKAIAAYDAAYVTPGATWSGKDVDEMKAAIAKATCKPSADSAS